jgi:6-phosphogluconolactonase
LLSDERWVPPTHADSNEKMLREKLLVENAAHAELLPLYAPNTSVADRCAFLNDAIATLNIPFACALLGMGGDGHIASLFPDLQDLDAYLEVDSSTFFVPVQTTASPHARLSLTGSALTRSDEIVLLFFGDDKRAVYEQAKTSATKYPVSRLLFQKRAPVHLFWAP